MCVCVCVYLPLCFVSCFPKVQMCDICACKVLAFSSFLIERLGFDRCEDITGIYIYIECYLTPPTMGICFPFYFTLCSKGREGDATFLLWVSRDARGGRSSVSVCIHIYTYTHIQHSSQCDISPQASHVYLGKSHQLRPPTS